MLKFVARLQHRPGLETQERGFPEANLIIW